MFTAVVTCIEQSLLYRYFSYKAILRTKLISINEHIYLLLQYSCCSIRSLAAAKKLVIWYTANLYTCRAICQLQEPFSKNIRYPVAGKQPRQYPCRYASSRFTAIFMHEHSNFYTVPPRSHYPTEDFMFRKLEAS